MVEGAHRIQEQSILVEITPSGSYYTDEIQFVTISSIRRCQDFGDLTGARYNLTGFGNETRVRCGGAYLGHLIV